MPLTGGSWGAWEAATEPEGGGEGRLRPPEDEETRPSRVPWALLLARTFGEDVFTCDSCGGPRRVVACVFSAAIAARILEHLHLASRPLPLARAQDPPQLQMYA